MEEAVLDQSASSRAGGAGSGSKSSSSTSQKELREARRRKILERGRDRLAYITGEVKTLPAPTTSCAPDGASTPGETGLKSLSNPGELPASPSEHVPADPAVTPSRSFDTTGISQRLTSVKAELQSLDATQVETTPSPPWALISTPELSTSQQQKECATPTTSESANSSNAWPNLSFAALSKSVDHTTSIRALLAIFLAVLLAIHWTYFQCKQPWGFGSMNYIPRWPASILIITDLTVVIGALLVGFVKVPCIPEKKAVDRGGLAVLQDPQLHRLSAIGSRLEGALNFGLLLTKASKGLVADMCIYFVTIVCVVSLEECFRLSLCAHIIR